MDLLYHHARLNVPRLHTLPGCHSKLNFTLMKANFESGKKTEFSNEVMISAALKDVLNHSYEQADIVVFDACPYSRHLHNHRDPYSAARIFNEQFQASSEIIKDQKPCVYLALHPMSYPRPWNKMRFCTALVEDKTVNGDDEDVIIPAGALQYPVLNDSTRPCLLTYFGGGQNRPEFSNVRKDILDRMKHDESKSSGTCIATGSGKAYIRPIQRSKFCFALPGDTRGGEKLAITIMNGCIPVIEYYSWRHLPFSNYLNYSKFAVRLDQNRSLRSLLSRLRLLNQTEYSSNLVKAQQWFDYTRRGPISPHALIWSEVADVWDISNTALREA